MMEYEADSDYDDYYEEEEGGCNVFTTSTLTGRSSVNRGYKGKFHRKHDNPRSIKPKDFYGAVVKFVCGGDHN